MGTPAVVVFDVNETLSDLAPMGRRFADVGAPESAARVWFASLLRDGFALTAAGTAERFATVAAEVLRSVLAPEPLTTDLDRAVEQVMDGFLSLSVHRDVPDGVRRLSEAARLVTLSNGSTDVAERLLADAGIRHLFERLLSVEDAGIWKPARGAYAHAAAACGVELGDMLLVAVHPWDIDGASRAGMRTAWVDRSAARYPAHFRPPDHTVRAISELPDVLG